ncbi:hypothetical protein GCM10022224_028310 [Nonomuraea antimicrobica]|uniref:Uncharacterized protein n=1 Tax=Nonomuraea antimicrobica TaxID=561173 RepID=A0ABP7BNE3_9ACTN
MARAHGGHTIAEIRSLKVIRHLPNGISGGEQSRTETLGSPARAPRLYASPEARPTWQATPVPPMPQ